MEAETTSREELISRLQEVARDLRITDIEMLAEAGSGHPGGTLSIAEMVAALFFHKLRLRPDEPDWPGRDRFILSKGHCIPIVYAAMAKLGFFEEKELMTLRKLGTRLQGHPDRRLLPGIEASTGSLGQGLSVAAGMAMAGKIDEAGWRVYCVLGDGEIQAGQVWEAAMFAPRHGLDNLTAILDHNTLQITGHTKDVMSNEPLDEKWRAFGWEVRSVNGHDYAALTTAITTPHPGKPLIVIANTVKGKGVSFMENVGKWHHGVPGDAELAQSLAELEAAEQRLRETVA